MKITKHLPNWCSGFELPTVDFSTLEELLQIEWVASWAARSDFFRFSKSDNRLMAELDKGMEWWVVGRFDSHDGVDLPKWKEPSYDEMIATVAEEMNENPKSKWPYASPA